MYFLRRDPVYGSEKVYEIRRKDTTDEPRTNMRIEKVKSIPIYNMPNENCSFATHGFFCLDFECGMEAEDFQHKSKVTGIYLSQLTQAIKTSLNAG